MINWSSINSKVRKNIISYITRNHPAIVVDSIEKTGKVYRIYLLNGLFLIFDVDGNHMKTSLY